MVHRAVYWPYIVKLNEKMTSRLNAEML